MGKHDPPSPQLLELLHYVEDLSGFNHSRPKTTSDAARILWFHIRRLRGLEVEWPLAQPGGIPGVVPLLEELAGVTSLQPDALAALTGAIRLLSGANITLSEAGQDITITGATPGIGAVLFDSTLGADAASIDTGAGGIAAGHSVLEVFMFARTSQAVARSTVAVTFNGDNGANYDYTRTTTLNATVSGNTQVAQTSWSFEVAGDTAQVGAVGTIRFAIPGYDQTTFHKTALVNQGMSDSVAANSTAEQRHVRWRNTGAINQVTMAAGAGNLRAGSRLLIYGRT